MTFLGTGSVNTTTFESPEQVGYHEVYVAKKRGIVDIETGLERIIEQELGIHGVKARIFSNYVVKGMAGKDFNNGIPSIFAELPVDEILSKGEFENYVQNKTVLRIEAKPGQYDQRVDAIQQCFQLSGVVKPTVRHIRTVALEKDSTSLSEKEKQKIEKYLCNLVEETNLKEAEKYLVTNPRRSPGWYDIIGGFRNMDSDSLADMAEKKGVMLQLDDLLIVQKHFRDELSRDPSLAELKVLMTYWSDHCRHTTFNTKLKHIDIVTPRLFGHSTFYAKPGHITVDGDKVMNTDIEKTLEKLMEARRVIGKGEEDLTLMEIITTPPKYLKKLGIKSLQKLDESEEINAFTYKTTIILEDGNTDEYLVMFKNETHNSPTQAAPFGGAATCIGGAIRDNLSGRGYTFYAMRVSGSSDPTEPLDAKTIGALSQRFISQFSALGHASYGNQIGIANGMVREYFSPGYRAKHMEVGYVVAYAPENAVIRSEPSKDDMVILFGGYVGRDGIGGAAVSSSGGGTHSEEVVGSHVQKGNAVIEGAIQSLMLDTEFTRLIKRCNDFGAGGISVAAGEIAPGLDIWLDAQKVKYEGMNDFEKAIAESQERMCIVIAPSDFEKAQVIANKYNLNLTQIGVVTNGEKGKGQVRMFYKNNAVVDLSREFIDSAGAPKIQERVEIQARSGKDIFVPFGREITDPTERFFANLARKEVALQKGLGSIFDSSVGAGSVLAPYGGRYQLSPQIAGVTLLPAYNRNVDGGDTNSYGLMSRTAIANAIGLALPILEKNSYLGAQYSVIEFVSKMVAVGVKREDIYFGLQEYFESLGKDDIRWGKITAMLLGAVRVMFELQIAAIGGKDSASGNAKDDEGNRVDVPPTLITLGNGTLDRDRVRSAEFQPIPDAYVAGSRVLYYPVPKDENGLPNWEEYDKILQQIEQMHDKGLILSSSVVGQGGLAATIAKMAIGNNIGFRFNTPIDTNSLYIDDFGGIVVEITNTGHHFDLQRCIGQTTRESDIAMGNTVVSLHDTNRALLRTLEPVYSTVSSGGVVDAIPEFSGKTHEILSAGEAPNILTNQPRVLIPVFPGTNSHRDTEQALRRAGFTNIHPFYFRNTSPEVIMESVKLFSIALKDTKVTVFSGGFSAGDEPDGSAKYMAMIMRMNGIREVLQEFLDKSDTLTLGICNGFQLLIKLGLFSGETPQVNESLGRDDITLAHNTNLRHITDMVGLQVTSNISPWLLKVKMGDTFVIPVSHGEGRLLASEAQIAELIKNGQVALQYLDEEGKPTNKQNGSVLGIAALTSCDGRVLGLMPHPERAYEFLFQNIPGNHFLPIFEGAADALGVNSKYII